MESEVQDNQPRISGIVSVLYILLMLAAGFVIIGPLAGLLLAMMFYDGSILQMLDQIQNAAEHPELKTPLFIMQGAAALIGLIVLPLIYLNAVLKKNAKSIFSCFPQHQKALIISAVVTVVFMVVNSVFIEWNQNLVFPEFLKDFEAWARQREDDAMMLTRMMTSFDTPMQFLFGFLIIAILPAIGEELVFRGLIQSELQRGTKNMHLAIWLSAILFSAIHMQFFGFVPRMLLGALFGYIYAWSGNLWLPIVAHFVNNGFTISMLYLNQLGYFDYDIESAEAAPWWAALIFAVITFSLLSYLRKTVITKDIVNHV
ncbi:MAG TPA: CPBP family intramembrane metalloprotease [Cyclobacteriaceae bacterium]|nr:CPBP family intramembrane metalloprotease [Cyclobacteriaceae bacterium]